MLRTRAVLFPGRCPLTKLFKRRVIYLDVIRVVACFLVIVNHTNSEIFLDTAPNATWFASLAYFFVSTTAVPLFLMVSGAVLLGRTDPPRKHWQRLARVLVALILFSGVYWIAAGNGLDPVGFVGTVSKGPVTRAFWYLYLYLGILLSLPLLQRLASVMTKADYLYLFALSLGLVAFSSILGRYGSAVLALPDQMLNGMSLFSSVVSVLFAGYYIETWLEPNRTCVVCALVLYLGLLAFQLGMTYQEYLANPGSYLFLDDRFGAPIVLQAMALFVVAKYALGRVEPAPAAQSFITTLGVGSFGVYLVSDLVIAHTEGVFELLSHAMHPLGAVVLWELVVVAIGYGVSWLLWKIPGVRRIL